MYPQAGGGDGQTMTEETGNYAVTRHVTHSEIGPGRISRMTVAVVVNDRMTMEGTGKTAHPVWKPRSAEEMKRLEELARAAVGFDATRGDQVVIENVGFSTNVPEVPATGLAKMTDQVSGFLQYAAGIVEDGEHLGAWRAAGGDGAEADDEADDGDVEPDAGAGRCGWAWRLGRRWWSCRRWRVATFGQGGPSMAKLMAGRG